MKRLTALAILVMVAVTGCDRAGDQETRTYELQRLGTEQALSLLSPYLEEDSRISATGGAVSVRATPEQLARVEAVLQEFDLAPNAVTLRFQIIEANGFTEVDPAVADVTEALRELFRYEGYRLQGEAVMRTTEYGNFSQMVRGSGGQTYRISGNVRDIGRSGGQWSVFMDVSLGSLAGTPILETSVNAPSGQTVVLGSAGPYQRGEGALILVVRPTLEGGAPTLGS